MNDLTDKEIINKLKKGVDIDYAFRILVCRYQEKLYRHIRRMTADHDATNDILQNTFLKVFKSIKNFREEAKLFTWLYQIATNETLTYINKNKKTQFVNLSENTYAIPYHQNDYIDGNAISEKLRKAIATLPDKQKIVFNLKYYDALKYEEISEITQTSVGALKASYHLAVKKIEHFLALH